MAAFLDRLLRLWREPLGDDAETAFRTVYSDPVTVNGAELSVADLVDRARNLQRAFDGLRTEILDYVEAPERIVVAFHMHGRHVGPLTTSLGLVAPTGRAVQIRTIDVLTLAGGLVTGVWVVADELGLLTQLGAATLTDAVRATTA